jgi:hypothetical protein
MTPQVRYYAEWRISVWLFRLTDLKESDNKEISASAIQRQKEAALLQSVIDTQADRHTPLQRRWHEWITAACELYHTSRKANDYLARANALRERRDGQHTQQEAAA